MISCSLAMDMTMSMAEMATMRSAVKEETTSYEAVLETMRCEAKTAMT